MKIILIILCILAAVFTLFLLTHSAGNVFTSEEAKAMCSDYCRMACKLNATQEDLAKIWSIEISVEKIGKKKCGDIVGNCICT